MVKPEHSEKPRSVATYEFGCHAPENFFVDEWENIERKNQFLIEKHGSLPCDGGGIPGPWCYDCYWSQEEETDLE